MVKVTDKDYYLDGFCKQICDKICDRVQKRQQDILCLFDGREGSGKTNASVACGYYIGSVTGRKFTEENMFFDLDEMIKFAGSTKEQIILWDEAALGGLSSDWSNKSQRKLKAMLMVCRKLRHVFLFNVPRFYRLNTDLIERSLCLFHIYENDKEQPGNFMFIGADSLVALFNNWRSTKRAKYWSFKKVHGCFTWVMPKLIDEEAYEAAKDAAILKLANNDQIEDKKDKLFTVRDRVIRCLSERGFKKKEIEEILDISHTLRREIEIASASSMELM